MGLRFVRRDRNGRMMTPGNFREWLNDDTQEPLKKDEILVVVYVEPKLLETLLRGQNTIIPTLSHQCSTEGFLSLSRFL